jgi:hypothetical protein
MPSALPTMPTPSASSTAAFVAIVLAVCASLLWGVVRAGRTLSESQAETRRWLAFSSLGLLAWLAATGAASASGVLEARRLPPPLMLFMLASLGVATVSAFSPLGTRLVRGVPIAALVGFQAFRLPLELVLHSWSVQHVVPVQMTFTGHNFDIVSGISALALGVWLSLTPEAPRALIWLWNCLASALLCAVTLIAVLSSPLPGRLYMSDPPLLLAFHFPYGFIVPICVGGALFGHLLVFRWLRASAKSNPAKASTSNSLQARPG